MDQSPLEMLTAYVRGFETQRAEAVVPFYDLPCTFIRPDGTRLLVTDLGSTNGTRIDAGERLAADTDVPLERGQKLLVGPAILEITATGGTESESGFGRTEKTVAPKRQRELKPVRSPRRRPGLGPR